LIPHPLPLFLQVQILRDLREPRIDFLDNFVNASALLIVYDARGQTVPRDAEETGDREEDCIFRVPGGYPLAGNPLGCFLQVFITKKFKLSKNGSADSARVTGAVCVGVFSARVR
jgi:hypothetical protein